MRIDLRNSSIEERERYAKTLEGGDSSTRTSLNFVLQLLDPREAICIDPKSTHASGGA